jgi:hypothetical protein
MRLATLEVEDVHKYLHAGDAGWDKNDVARLMATMKFHTH